MKVTDEVELYAGDNAVFEEGAAFAMIGTTTEEGHSIVDAAQIAPDRITLTVEYEVAS